MLRLSLCEAEHIEGLKVREYGSWLGLGWSVEFNLIEILGRLGYCCAMNNLIIVLAFKFGQQSLDLNLYFVYKLL